MAASQTVTIQVALDLKPALAGIDALLAALTDMRDRLSAEMETLVAHDAGE